MNPAVTSSYDTGAFERAIAPMLRLISPEQARQVADYRGDDTLRRRVTELAEKHNEGELSADELAEYEAYVRANQFVAILQGQMRKIVASASSR